MATKPEIPTKEEEGQPQKPPEETDEELPSEQESVNELKSELEAREKRILEMEAGVQKLKDRNELLEAKLEEFSSSETPSEEKLAKEIPDWEMLSPVEQKLIRDHLALNKEVTHLRGALNKAVDKLNWEDGFSEAIKKFPNLSKRKSEFREYCYKPENLKTPLEVLARSFLFEDAQEMGAKKEKEILERQGLEKSSGGEKPTVPPRGKMMTIEESERLRMTDPKKYMDLARKGKLPDIEKPKEE